MVKLSEAQRKRLRDIADYQPTASFPHAGFWKHSKTDQSLVRHGLISRIQHASTLGGGGAIGAATVTWNLCDITEAGRKALEGSE